jgi:hypothetical protein
MVSPETGAPADWQVESKNKQGAVVRAARNIKRAVPVGQRSQGSPVVAHGLVWVGTNDYKKEGEQRKDFSVLKCFRESDGKLLYEYWSPRPSGKGFHQHHDWPGSSMASSPLIEGDRLWIRTNRAEVLCLDIGPRRRRAESHLEDGHGAGLRRRPAPSGDGPGHDAVAGADLQEPAARRHRQWD